MGRKIKVLIVDDEAKIRKILRITTTTVSGNEIVGEAGCAQSAMETFREAKPDLVLLDISMPDVDGIELLKQMKQINPDVRVVMITSINDPPTVRRCIEAGANNYVLKNIGPEAIREVIKQSVYECFTSIHR